MEGYVQKENGFKGHTARRSVESCMLLGTHSVTQIKAVRDKKIPSGNTAELEDVNVAVSVNHLFERVLNIRFYEILSVLPAVERQLTMWAELFQTGKRLRVNIHFNYKECETVSVQATRSGNRGGRISATRRMLGERACQLDAEEASTGQQVGAGD